MKTCEKGRGIGMKKKFIAVIVTAALILGVVVLIRSAKDPRGDYHFQVDSVLKIYGEKDKIEKNERAFLVKTMFKNPGLYSRMPLIQKKLKGYKGTLPGAVVPASPAQVLPKFDFAYKTHKGKTFFKLLRTGSGPSSRVICRYIRKPAPPKSTHPYAFTYTASTKKYGTIPYMCYVEGKSPAVNAALRINWRR